jgi:Ca2+:H+ antiporter
LQRFIQQLLPIIGGTEVTDAPQPSAEDTTPNENRRAVAALQLAAAADAEHQQDSSEERNTSHNGGGGHDAPEWSKTKSAIVLLSSTVLFSMIAELLVESVDVVIQGFDIDEKFLGLTLFALVPNVTEFMNAIAFAMYGNVALSMEIGSAYTVQVAMLQIPALLAFSTWYNWGKIGQNIAHHAFYLMFPRWDVIVTVFSVFLLTYTYIEGKSNYFKGSILTFAYLIFVVSFYYEPSQ